MTSDHQALDRFQAAFAAALRGAPADSAALGLEVTDLQRLEVYRANRRVALREALAQSYPCVRAFVGDDVFAAFADAYARAHPPREPTLMTFGEAFSAFLAAFPPAAARPELADIARLDHAWVAAVFAADAPVLSAEALARLDQSALGRSAPRLHPSVRLLASPHGAYTMWKALRAGDRPALGALEDGPERAVIWAHDGRARHSAIASGVFGLLDGLERGGSLEAAIAAGRAADPNLKLDAALATVAGLGLLTDPALS